VIAQHAGTGKIARTRPAVPSGGYFGLREKIIFWFTSFSRSPIHA